MAYNLTTGGGDFTPFIKYNAKAGRWYVRDENGNDVEVDKPRFAIDLERAKLGWIYFPPAGAPQFVWDVNGVRQAQPDSNFKDGFEVMLYGADPVMHGKPLGIRIWTSNSISAKTAINKLHDAFMAGREQNPDKVPVARCVSIERQQTKHGDVFEPVFAIETWVERNRLPEEMRQATEPTPRQDVRPEAPPPTSEQDYGAADPFAP